MQTSNSSCLFPVPHALVKALQTVTQPCCFPRKSISIFHMRLAIGRFLIYMSIFKGAPLQQSFVDCYVSSFPMTVSSSSPLLVWWRTSPSSIIPSVKLSLPCYPTCWKRYTFAPLIQVDSVSSKQLLILKDHGHRSQNPAADTRCATNCWPTRSTQSSSGPSPSPARSRTHSVVHHALDHSP